MRLEATPRENGAGRYAPSPSGPLHAGNLRTALAAWNECRRGGLAFILRIEDTDLPRNVPGAEQAIIDDLRFLGIEWDEGPDIGGPARPYRQSERQAIYREALLELGRKDLVYPCTCSRKTLRDSSAAAPHGLDGPVYPGICANAHPRGTGWIDRLLDNPRPDASIRFRVPVGEPIRFTDAVLGEQSFDMKRECGDFVICRRDGLWAYQFACAVDDGLMGITRVLRGDDLVTSTPRQIALLQAFGFAIPRYAHVPLLRNEEGKRLSKRDGSESLRQLIEKGITKEEILDRLSLPGNWSDSGLDYSW